MGDECSWHSASSPLPLVGGGGGGGARGGAPPVPAVPTPPPPTPTPPNKGGGRRKGRRDARPRASRPRGDPVAAHLLRRPAAARCARPALRTIRRRGRSRVRHRQPCGRSRRGVPTA